MEPLSDTPQISVKHLEIVQAEFEATRRALEPTSRNTLAVHLSRKADIPYKMAILAVDKFCEDNNQAVPDYLGREFAVGWLKVVAVLNVIIATVFLWYGREFHLRHESPYLLWCLGAVFCGLAVLSWIKSLEKEAENARSDYDPVVHRNSIEEQLSEEILEPEEAPAY